MQASQKEVHYGFWRDSQVRGGAEFRALREYMGLSVEDFARVTCASVSEWNEAARARVRQVRVHADIVLYALTPLMEGCYSVAEAVDDSNKRPASTVMVLLAAPDGGKEFTSHQLRALRQTGELVKRNGAAYFESLEEAVDFIAQRTTACQKEQES